MKKSIRIFIEDECFESVNDSDANAENSGKDFDLVLFDEVATVLQKRGEEERSFQTFDFGNVCFSLRLLVFGLKGHSYHA